MDLDGPDTRLKARVSQLPDQMAGSRGRESPVTGFGLHEFAGKGGI